MHPQTPALSASLTLSDQEHPCRTTGTPSTPDVPYEGALPPPTDLENVEKEIQIIRAMVRMASFSRVPADMSI